MQRAIPFLFLLVTISGYTQKKYPLFSVSINKIELNADYKYGTLNNQLAYSISSNDKNIDQVNIQF